MCIMTYADEIVLIRNSLSSLDSVYEQLTDDARIHGLKLNKSRTKCIMIKRTKSIIKYVNNNNTITVGDEF